MVMKAQSVMQLKLYAFFIFSLEGDMRSGSVSKETAHSNNWWAQRQLQHGDDRKSHFSNKTYIQIV